MFALLSSLACASAMQTARALAMRGASHQPAARALVTMAAKKGDVASITYSLRPDMSSRASKYGDDADKLVDSLPFDIGSVRFGVNAGGYLDGIHAAVAQMAQGESKDAVSIDAGAGELSLIHI